MEERSKTIVINGGSSSVKISLFDASSTELSSAANQADPILWSENKDCNLLDSDDAEICKLFEDLIKNKQIAAESVFCVGHRVVHGGANLRKPERIDDRALCQIEELRELAPVHNPIAAKLIRASRRVFHKSEHLAVFDTAFHSTLDAEAYMYPLPFDWYEEWGIRKFGFHGINHQYCSEAVRAKFANKSFGARIVVAHLGNGCSMSAVKDGISIDTTMGFTPLEGLMMGARSGSIDPGIIFYLIHEKKMSPEDIESCMNNKSGLAGVSGLGKDMREIEKSITGGNKRSQLAFNMFVKRVAEYVARMAVSLGGIDTLVFTGGIGEHSIKVRLEVCKKLEFLHLSLDEKLNSDATADGVLSSADSAVQILRIAAREDLQIYRECQKLMKEGA